MSVEALQVIAGIPPIDLLAKERRIIFESNQGQTKAVRDATRLSITVEWQTRWNELEDKAQWTKKLIPDISKWVQCGHRTVDFHLTQFFTGHGAFLTFTHRIGKTSDDKCVYCGVTDTPAHTVIDCPRWCTLRSNTIVGTCEVTQMVDLMIGSRVMYESIRAVVTKIMRIKEFEEREREKGCFIF